MSSAVGESQGLVQSSTVQYREHRFCQFARSIVQPEFQSSGAARRSARLGRRGSRGGTAASAAGEGKQSNDPKKSENPAHDGETIAGADDAGPGQRSGMSPDAPC